MTRDSREFSAALLLGAVGGAALALAIRSGASRSRGKSRAWSDLLSGLEWQDVVASLRTAAEPVLESKIGSKVGAKVGAAGSSLGSGARPGVESGLGSGLDALRTASRRLRELGSQVAPVRR